LTFAPSSWIERMNTIETYEQDESAVGRINAWRFAYNLADDRILGGGFEAFKGDLFRIYAPFPDNVHDAHSIYFEIMGEHGFIGLFLFLTLWLLTWLSAQQVIKKAKRDEKLTWLRDLASMLQVSIVAYAVGGIFLGLAYFDLPYHLIAMVVIAKVLVNKENAKIEQEKNRKEIERVKTPQKMPIKYKLLDN